MQRAIFLPGSIDGCALWRFFMPHLKLPGSSFTFNPGFVLPMDRIQLHDVAIVQRLGSVNNIQAIKSMKNFGKKVVYDLDDNLWDIPVWNSASKGFRSVRELFTRCISECDYVIASTQALQAAIRRHAKTKVPVRVIANAIDFDLFAPLPRSDMNNMVTVGWGGSATHDKDIGAVFALIPDLLEKNERMRFESVGAEIGKLADHPKVKPRMQVPIAEYPSRLSSWRWDIFLAPLVDHPFNRSKSNIKILEAAALRKPILVSPVGPYLDFCRIDKELDWLMCRTLQQWKDKITALVNDDDLRDHYGNLLYDTAWKHFNIRDAAQKWKNVFEEIM